jgi:hypothetical protein
MPWQLRKKEGLVWGRGPVVVQEEWIGGLEI